VRWRDRARPDSKKPPGSSMSRPSHRTIQPFFRIALTACVASLAGCLSIPSQETASMPSADSYKLDRQAQAALDSDSFTRGDWPGGEWWRQFDDPQLDKLMAQALADSPDIRIARSRVQLAEQQAAAVHAGNLPELSANANATRVKYSENWIIPPDIAQSALTQGQISLDAGLDLDLWSRNRDLYRARLGEVQATAAEQAETRLVISAALARAYFRWQGDLARLDLAHAAVAERRDFAKLVRLRAAHGLETQAAVDQAEADVAREQANVVARERDAQADRREMAALMGQGPNAADAIAVPPRSRFDEPFPVPEILPVDLLSRRPDVTAGRWRVEAAAREVGAVKAGFYPNINIAGSIGLQSLELKNLFKSGSGFSSLGPAIHLPIFEGGRLRADLGAARAEYDIAVEQYRRALVDATREVADRLAAVRSLAQEREHQQQALAHSEEAYRIARLRYQQGIADYLSVLQAQRDLLRQRDVNAQLDEARMEAALGLIKALGGGYVAASAPPARS